MALQQKTDNAIAAAEEARAACLSQAEFLSNMNHELRTPLNHIIGFTELVLDKKYGPLNSQQEEFLHDVLQSSRNLLNLINAIMDIAKADAGRTDLAYAEVYLRSVLEGSLAMIREKALKHRIKLTAEIPDRPESFQADERKLKQILYSLLSNAVKFTPDGGAIRVRVALDQDAFSGRPGLRFSIIDTGIGLRNSDLEQIFHPFRKAAGMSESEFQGAGLGLSLARKLVEIQGGRIWAESEGEGKGSGFYFVLPLQQEGAG